MTGNKLYCTRLEQMFGQIFLYETFIEVIMRIQPLGENHIFPPRSSGQARLSRPELSYDHFTQVSHLLKFSLPGLQCGRWR